MYQYFELVRSLYTETKTEVILGLFLRPVDVPCTPKNNARKKKVKTLVPAKKTEAQSCYTNHVSTHEKKKQPDQHREHNCNRPLTPTMSTTLYPLTSIIPCKKRLSSP